ncbi:MAG: efflux RND transporter periplasmic adaptor subunit [Selenomonadaceae bacterium]|nr:efflux RND transporter periplasmic adaptor subunit [Selenomonadaceae bacterium]
MKKKFFAVALLSTILFSGCGDEKIEQPPPPVVKTILVNRAGITVSENYSGVVKGRYESNLSFQTGGRILSREVQKGSFVHAGDVLMTIDARDAVQQANAGEAQVAQAKSQLDLAKSDLNRYRELYEENAIPAVTLDQYKTNYENALAVYNAAVAQSAQTQNILGYTKLIANADGVISAVNAEAGQVVAAGQTVLTLVQVGELEVEFDVPENRLSEVVEGKNADVTFWAVGGTASGVVREISPMADETARTYRVRISLNNPPPAIQLGMTAEVTLTSQDSSLVNSCVLPLSAIYQTGKQAQVWIVTKENTVALKNVTVKNFSGNEVVVHGLSPQDKVVTAGVHKLHEGMEVRTEAAR